MKAGAAAIPLAATGEADMTAANQIDPPVAANDPLATLGEIRTVRDGVEIFTLSPKGLHKPPYF